MATLGRGNALHSESHAHDTASTSVLPPIGWDALTWRLPSNERPSNRWDALSWRLLPNKRPPRAPLSGKGLLLLPLPPPPPVEPAADGSTTVASAAIVALACGATGFMASKTPRA
jgi:hypothetical protein